MNPYDLNDVYKNMDKNNRNKREDKYRELFKEGNEEQLKRLNENSNKDGWDNIDIQFAMNRILCNSDEMDKTIYYGCSEKNNNKKGILNKIKEEAADIANFAHMIIYKCNKLIKDI